MTRRGAPVWLVAVVVLVAVGWFLVGGSTGTGTGSAATSTDDSAVVADRRFSDLDTIAVAELPDEALVTLDLISDGGPYPFRRDDMIFENRERILPLHDTGYYREYTVVTPGSDDRGARRIVAGSSGELFYTDDHYSSFREIVGSDP